MKITTLNATVKSVETGSATSDNNILLQFNSSELTNDFLKEDIIFSGGEISQFKKVDSTYYTAVLTPIDNDIYTIDVDAKKFTAEQFTWTKIDN